MKPRISTSRAGLIPALFPRWRSAFLILVSAVSVTSGVYSQQFDLSKLPPYKAEQQVFGVIRIHGNQIPLNLVALWEAGFMEKQHAIRYKDYLLTTPTAFSGLCTGTADVGVMGHSWWRSDLKAFEGIFGYDPLEIKFATGSFDHGSTPAPVFFINKNNPITGLTLKQLDGIFGAERTGGWRGSKWTTDVARGPEENIRTWGQLGLTGEWADKPIHLYGIDATLSNWSDLVQKVVFKGGDKWNPAINEIVRGGIEVPADAQIVSAVANDPYGIGFNFMKVVKKDKVGVKVVALASNDGAPFVVPTAESCQNGSYPMNNAVYIYLNRPPGKPLPPRVKEFLRYILSRDGQQAVAKDETYLPLTEEMARAELKKLE